MIEPKSTINITVDENALREQIREILMSELRAFSWSLRKAADQLDPDFWVDIDKNREEAEQHAYERGLADAKGEQDV